MKTNKNIDCVNEISISDFKKHYYYPQKPVLIKGLANKYPAGKKWNLEFLKTFCSDVTVDLFDNSAQGSAASAYTVPDLQMKFSEYMDIITKDEPSSLRVFLFNMFKRKPELRKDFPCPDLFKGILGKFGYMFFGSKGITVRIHQDIDMSGVLLTQFHGRKKVVLVSPQYSDLLYRLPFNTYSLVNLDKPDYKKYPGLEYVEASECVIEPGDALFMPSGYWHYITYLDGGFGVSYRKLAPGIKMKILGLLSLAVYMPFDKLMNKLWPSGWLKKKEQIAEKKANKAIMKLMQLQNSGIRHKTKEKEIFGSQLQPGHF